MSLRAVPGGGRQQAVGLNPSKSRSAREQEPTPRYQHAHPIPLLRGPFEESIWEAQSNSESNLISPSDGPSRRAHLLASNTYERTCSGRWRQRRGERYHPLWKLIAQLSFGLHLLAGRAARSEVESVKIMQSHVNEIDGFLQRTAEDIQLASQDITKRIIGLEDPLENLKTFDAMLERRDFRLSILHINDAVDHVAERSLIAMQDAQKDVEKGLQGVSVFGRYLRGGEKNQESATFEAVQKTMVSNVQGWSRTFLHLHTKGQELAQLLARLSSANSELRRQVAFASRKHIVHTPNQWPSQASALDAPRQASNPRLSKLLRQRTDIPSDICRKELSLDKPLPGRPQNLISGIDPLSINQILSDYNTARSPQGRANIPRRSVSLAQRRTAQFDGHPRRFSVATFASPVKKQALNSTEPAKWGTDHVKEGADSGNENSATPARLGNPRIAVQPLHEDVQVRNGSREDNHRDQSGTTESRRPISARPALSGRKSGLSLRSLGRSIRPQNQASRSRSAVTALLGVFRTGDKESNSAREVQGKKDADHRKPSRLLRKKGASSVVWTKHNPESSPQLPTPYSPTPVKREGRHWGVKVADIPELGHNFTALPSIENNALPRTAIRSEYLSK